ncbi:MAG: 50S ribosomal protein L18 [Bacteroidales bacterium]
MALAKQERRNRIRLGIRKKVAGTKEKPRMSVYRSNKNIFVQLIDDVNGVTLAAASSLVKEIAEKKEITKKEQAALVGKLLASKSAEVGISDVVFDRGGYLYHGRVKALADSARENGLKF